MMGETEGPFELRGSGGLGVGGREGSGSACRHAGRSQKTSWKEPEDAPGQPLPTGLASGALEVLCLHLPLSGGERGRVPLPPVRVREDAPSPPFPGLPRGVQWKGGRHGVGVQGPQFTSSTPDVTAPS